MVPSRSLSTHRLAVPVRVMGKTRNMTTSCDTPGMLTKLTMSKTRSTCSWASSLLFPEKVSFLNSHMNGLFISKFTVPHILDFESLVRRFLKSGEFNHAFGDVISLAMSSAESSLRDIAQLEPDLIVPLSKASSVTVSLGVGTRDRSSTPFVGAFGHTSTLEHLKRKKPYGSGASSIV
ncbi:hypothetical protein Tco_0097827 [Tanacetum coccineum]